MEPSTGTGGASLPFLFGAKLALIASVNGGGGANLFRRLFRFRLYKGALEVIPKLDLGAVAMHDDALLDHRERVVPGPVDNQARRESGQHESEDKRHPVEDDL